MAQKGRHSADHKLVTALACGSTIENAAKQAGVSERTAYRRRNDPAFMKQVDDARADMSKRTMGMMTALGVEAVKTLAELLKPANPSATRLGAARSLLELQNKYRELIDFQERLAVVEQNMAAREPAKNGKKKA
jgi:hypothetical protein